MWWSWKSFLLGFTSATVVFGLMMAGGLGSLVQTGVTVHVDPAPILAQIEMGLVGEAETQIQQLLASVRRDLPSQVAGQVAGTFRGLSLSVYDVQVPLPEEVVRRMETSLRDSLSDELDVWLEDVNWDPLLEELTCATRRGVYDLLDGSAVWDLELNLPGPWSMPVHITGVP